MAHMFQDQLPNLVHKVSTMQHALHAALYSLYALYCYTNEDLGKWFVNTLGNRFHVKFLVYSYWFMSIRISQLKDHSISVDQARYATSVVAKYLDTATVKVSKTFYKTTLPADMIFPKEDVSTSDEQVEKLTIEYNIHYRAYI